MSVFITGASSGIGEACARAFAQAGKDLVLVARRKDRLEKLAASLKSETGVKIDCFELDVQSQKAVTELFRQQEKVFKSVDVLVNNAGLALGRASLQSGESSDWDTMIDTNVKGLLYVTRAFLPLMIEAKKGHIVNLGSVAGHWVYPGGNIYCATKYAVKALSEGLRMDLLGTGIRVTEIAPGMVETEFSEVRFKGDAEKAKAVYQGFEALTPSDIVESIAWCVSRPSRVNIQSLVIYPTAQASPTQVAKKEAVPFG